MSLYLSGASLLGKSVSSLLSQILYDYASVTYLELNYLSLASVSVAILISFFIRSPQYIKSRSSTINPTSTQNDTNPSLFDSRPTWLENCRENFIMVLKKVKLSYGSAQTRRWAYWAIVSTTLYYMVS